MDEINIIIIMQLSVQLFTAILDKQQSETSIHSTRHSISSR